MLRALLYAYVLGGVTFIPLIFFISLFIAIYTSVPISETSPSKQTKRHSEVGRQDDHEPETDTAEESVNDLPRTRRGWLIVRRTFQEVTGDGSYVTLVRSFLDSRSKDPKRSRPKDMWYVVLKGTVLYLYEDEEMSECDAVIELGHHRVIIFPENLPDAELFAKRNAICLMPKNSDSGRIQSISPKSTLQADDISTAKSLDDPAEDQLERNIAKEKAVDPMSSWFIFVRSNVDMEDWYLALIHASELPPQAPTLSPLHDVFDPVDMNHLVSTLDEQPDVIPMRWLNGLLGRIFFSHYRTQALESFIIAKLMKKLSKVKRPAFLTEIAVTNVSVGRRAPMFSKPMLKELTKEGDASIEIHLDYKGEVRITVEATAVINLGARFKSYTVKLVLAAVLKEMEGNLLIRIKRPPSNRIWYAFTQTPRMVMEVEPIVSDRQITWGMILGTIESKIKEIIQESVVMPNMDDIAFFDTEPYDRRGGIWSDAVRKSSSPSSIYEDGLQRLVSADAKVEHTQKGDDASIKSAPPAVSTPLEVSSLPTSPEGSPDSSRNLTSRRRTWFSSTSDHHVDTSSAPSLLSGSYSEYRIQALESDTPNASDSSDQPPSMTVVEGTTEQEVPSTTTRSISQRDHEIPNIVDDGLHKSSPVFSPIRKTSDDSTSGNLPSFFSTLKARTADKQAIKESAKEAIRKWGVNWGGFRKDDMGTGQVSENLESSTNRSSTPQTEGSGKDSILKTRTSYVEVRAAVEERKEREKALELPSRRAEPLEAAGSQNENSDDPESAPFETSGATLSRSPSPSGIVTKDLSPPVSRVNTEHVHYQDRAPGDSTKPTPIYVQPVAKTMSIPGIHVSHRGEVQSMGYVAPQPDSLPSSGPTVLKNPAIQTMYRFLKSSNGDRKQDDLDHLLHDQSNNTSGTLSLGSPAGTSTDEMHLDELPGPPVEISMPKSVPPPLPPRTVTMSSRQHGRSSVSKPSIENDGSDSAAPQASLDDNLDLDMKKTGDTWKAIKMTPPPLPPRRMPVVDAQ